MGKMEPGLIGLFAEQVGRERQNSAEYEALAIALDYAGYTGFGAWMRKQADGELDHARRLEDHLQKRRASYGLPATNAPAKIGLVSPADTFEKALEIEEATTESLSALLYQAEESGDTQAAEALRWFIAEQTEEEDAVQAYIDLFEIAQGNPAAILALDARAGEEAGNA